ncbi:MAG: hemerythrin domain-containing protein [Desulfobacterales bacterium]
MQPIKELRMEHNAVQMTLRILEKICQQFDKSKENLNIQHLEQLLEFFRVFVDKCHHGKEEELLFPALEHIGVGNMGEPIAVMLHEHQQGREYVQTMNAAFAQYIKGDRRAADEFVKTAREYINLLEQHIDKENNVLFPLAEKHLSEQKQVRLSEGFERIETEKIGTGKHDEFHKMLENLESVYLK